MKKFLAMMLALCMVFSLCACGAKEEAPAAAPKLLQLLLRQLPRLPLLPLSRLVSQLPT